MAQNHGKTTTKKASTHDVTMPLVEAMFGEFKDLAKKRPEAAVSKNKLLIANRLLQRVREVLADEECIEFLDLLDEDDVPQVSDVTLIFSQYVAAMQAFKIKHHGWNGAEHGWFVE
jgi:hypothetical protein